MLTEERRRLILDVVRDRGSATSAELARRLAVSPMTVYRDLRSLEDENLLRRVRGGAISLSGEASSNEAEAPFLNKREREREKKDAIAAYAAGEFVTAGDVVILEAGTTVSAMVRHLRAPGLTLVTNGIETINEASSRLADMTVMCCGGTLREPARTFVGLEAESFFAGLHADTLFLGATGLDLPEGITDPSSLEIQVKRVMTSSARRTVLLLDSSKFGVRSLKQIVPLERIEAIITDAGAPERYLTELRRRGVEVHVVAVG